MIKKSKDELRRRIFDEKGFRRGYFINRIINISHWLEVVKERFSKI